MLRRYPAAGRSVLLVLCALAALLGRAPAGPAQSCPAGPATRAGVLCELNAVRAAQGLGALHARDSLASAATAHARDMVARRYFAHTSPEGDGPAQRARRAGYQDGSTRWRLGEILLWRRGEPLTAAAAVQAWLASPGHRRVVLTGAYRDAGVGLADGAPLGDPATVPAVTVAVVVGRRR